MSKIPVSLIHNVPYIFDANDYMKLRTDYRIVGNIIGIPTSFSRNLHLNGKFVIIFKTVRKLKKYFPGLPAILSFYEVRLLLEEENVIVLLDKSGLKKELNSQAKQNYEEQKTRQQEPQIEDYVEQRLEKSRKYIDKIIAGKRKKLLKSGVPEEDIRLDPNEVLEEEAQKIRETISGNLLVQIPTEHPVDVETQVIQDFDFSSMDPIKYNVFKDLWKRGKFVTPGDYFGSDFLVYPGDPLFYHASHKIHIVKKDHKFDPKFLVANARLAITINKKCTFVFQDDDGHLIYQTLSWTNLEK
jgi:tRNA-splicing endonuclease subunit Sen34